MRAGLMLVCSAWVAIGAMPGAWPEVRELIVSTDGNDAWSGHLYEPNADKTDGPLATLEAARDAIRQLRQSGTPPEGGVVVQLRKGVYLRDRTFELGPEDSGSNVFPITYRAYEHEAVRLMGGKAIGGFKPVTDAEVLKRIEEPYRDKVLETDLKAQGITDFGTFKRRGFGLPSQSAALELFLNGQPMTLARWPNDGWVKIAAVPAGPQGGKFTYEGDRPAQWKDVSDLWVHGYWTWDWADSIEKVEKLDAAAKEISTAPPHGVYGYKQGARFFFQNVLEELDQPGEYYLDRQTGKLYFWPPAPLEGVEVTVSLLEGPLVALKDVSFVTLQGLTFACGRGPGLTMSGGERCLIAGCPFQDFGTFGASIDGRQHGFGCCDLAHLGEGGISMNSGDRVKFKPGLGFILNNEIQDFGRTVRTYTPAISVSGVSIEVGHNYIHDAPHMAIGLGGNEHHVEYNVVHHVCMETSDAGAFYMGRDWTQRGNVIRFNFFHDLGHGDVQAIYLDDWTSGTTVYGNICCGALRGVLIGGGRDNVVENNVFVNCGTGVHIDQRGLGWAKSYFNGQDNTLFDRYNAVNASKPPYAARYPELEKLLEDEPALAKNNKVLRNICVGGKFLDLADGLTETTPYLVIKDNFLEGDPGFVDPAKLDFRLKPESPVLAQGFRPLPIDILGLYKDGYRSNVPLPLQPAAP